MDILKHDNTTRELGAPSNWDDKNSSCSTLPIVDMQTNNGNAMVSFWQPNEKEIEALKKGEPIQLWIYGDLHPVVAVHINEIQEH